MAYQLNPKIIMQLEHATAFLRNGRFLQAQLICNDLVKEYPNDVNVIHVAGLVAAEAKEYDKAETYFIKATELEPKFAQAFYNLGMVYMKKSVLKKALTAFEKSIALDKKFIPAYKAMGETYFTMNLTDEALDCYNQSLAIKEEVDILCRLAKIHASKGELDNAASLYRRALTINTEYPTAYLGLSRLPDTKFTAEEITVIESLLTKNRDVGDQISLHYTLHKAYADAGNVDQAFYHLNGGSSLRRSSMKYNAANNTLLTDRLIATFTEDFFKSRHDFGHQDKAPIFILSMPRAGSTLTEQILSSHSQIFGAGELSGVIFVALSSIGLRDEGADFVERVPHLMQEDCDKLGGLYIELCKKWRLQDTPFFTDKLPANFSLVGFINLILPNAKIIHVHRDPIDTCFGCYKVNFAGDLNYAYDMKELGQFYCDYWRLMQHWHTVLPGKIYDLSYENLVQNQEAETRKLIDYLGLEWEEQCLRFYETQRTVKTASAAQVRKPITTKNIGLWKDYEKHLAPLIEALAPVLNK